MITKTCEFCQIEFKTYPSVDKKCCTAKCAYELRKARSHEKYKQVCEECGKEFLPKRQAEGGRFCSYKCSGAAGRVDRVVSGTYVRLRMPQHPHARRDGYVLEHRHLMEQSIGRYLRPDEVVHHINGDKQDNRLENLELLVDSEHKTHHALEANAGGRLNTPEQILKRKRSPLGTFTK